MSIPENVAAYLESEYSGSTTAAFRDLSLNLKKILEESPLEPQERFLNLLSIAVALENKALVALAKQTLTELGVTKENIQEAAEVAGIMGMNNVYYKFKSYLPAETVEADYKRAGLRMNSLGNPANGKTVFEMMALSVSVVNGCSTCVVSHERTLRTHNVTPDKIHDLARLAAVAKGLTSLKKAMSL